MMVLIDGDILVYRAAFAAERTRYVAYEADEEGMPVGSPLWNGYGWADCRADLTNRGYDVAELYIHREREYDDEPIAVNNVREMMKRILLANDDVFKEVGYFLALSTGTETFRHKEATVPYKASRKEMEKPRHYEAVRRELIDNWQAVEFRSVEADDVLALAQQERDDTVIASIDKDLLQVPGQHYHIVGGETITVPPLEAYRHLCVQRLTGDSTDDIPGIYRVGPAKALKALKDVPPEFWDDEILSRWEEYSKTERYAKDWGDTPYEEAAAEVTLLVTVGGERTKQELNNAPEEKEAIEHLALSF